MNVNNTITTQTQNISQNNSKTLPKNTEVDESLFIPQGQLSEDVYANNEGATTVFKPSTPEEAWQQYAFSTSGSMVEVSTTIPAGYQDVNHQLKTLLSDHGLQAPEGMALSFGLPKGDDLTPEQQNTPVFLVENVEDETLTKQIESLLNDPQSAHFKQSYLALDKLTAAENTYNAQQRDNAFAISSSKTMGSSNSENSFTTYGYQQDFALSFDGENFQMNATVELVELMRLEKLKS